MERINLTLSNCVLDQIQELAKLLKVSRADLIYFFLEGSTYLRDKKIAGK